MKVSKQQLRRIIREEKARILMERASPAVAGELDRNLRTALVEFIDGYMGYMGMNSGDAADRQRVRMRISDMITTVLGR